MSMVLIDYVDWDESQWQEYEDAMVTISLQDLGHFVTAYELLYQGKSLAPEEYEAWIERMKPIIRLYVDELGKISQNKEVTK